MNEHVSAVDVRRKAEEAAALFPALRIEAERVARTVASGLHGRRRAGPGETFWQHRAYSFGDPVSMIDWRQSARASDRLYIRENEWEASAPVYIWRDPSRSLDYASSKMLPTKRRHADVLAVALTILLSQAGERIGLLGEERRPFHGRTAPTRILEALQITHFQDEISTPPPAQLPSGAKVVMFSDFFTHPDNIAKSLETLTMSGAEGALVQICDPAEEDFPFGGRIEFKDLESADRLIFGDASSIGGGYKKTFKAHREALAAFAQQSRWSLITHRTDRSLHTVLLALYAALEDVRNWKR